METFVLRYGLLRWGVLAGFVITAVSVTVRLSRVRPECAVEQGLPSADRDSEAAHLVMCVVMAAMLGFPVRAAPEAVRGVLIAMAAVYAVLLGSRIINWHRGVMGRHAVVAIGYHLAAVAAMLLAMSGTHGMAGGASMGGSGSRVPRFVLLTAAAIFAVDAVLMSLPTRGELRRRLIPHGPAGVLPVLPHVVMDLGTVYMLVAGAPIG